MQLLEGLILAGGPLLPNRTSPIGHLTAGHTGDQHGPKPLTKGTRDGGTEQAFILYLAFHMNFHSPLVAERVQDKNFSGFLAFRTIFLKLMTPSSNIRARTELRGLEKIHFGAKRICCTFD